MGNKKHRTVIFKKMEVNGVSLTIAPVYYLNKISSLRTQAEPGSVPKLRRQGSEFREIRVARIYKVMYQREAF